MNSKVQQATEEEEALRSQKNKESKKGEEGKTTQNEESEQENGGIKENQDIEALSEMDEREKGAKDKVEKKAEEKAEKEEKRETEVKEYNKVVVFFISILSGILAVVSGISRFIVILFDIFVSPRARELMPLVDVTRTMFVAGTEILAGTRSQEIIQTELKLSELAKKQEVVAKGYAVRKAIGQSVDYGLSAAMLALWPVLTTLHDVTKLPMPIVIFLASSITMILATIAMFFGPVYGLFYETRRYCIQKGAYRAGHIFKMLENIAGLPFLASKSGFTVLDTPPVDADTLDDFKREMKEQADEMRRRIMDLAGESEAEMPERAKELLEEMLEKTEQDLGDIDFRSIQEEVARDFALIFFELENRYLPWRSKRALKIFAEMNGLSIREAKKAIEEVIRKLEEGKLNPDFLNSVMTTGALKGLISREEEYSEIMEDLALNKVSLALALGGVQYFKDFYAPRPWYKQIWKKIVNLFYLVFALPIVTLMMLGAWGKYIGKQLQIQLKTRPLKRIWTFQAIRYREIKTTLLSLVYSKDKKKVSLPSLPPPKKILKVIIQVILKILFIVPFALYKLLSLIYGAIASKFRENPELRKNKFQEEAAIYALAYMMDEAYKRCILEEHLYIY